MPIYAYNIMTIHSNINITETEHPARMHQQDINACVHHIRDAVVDYLESDILLSLIHI